MSVDIPDEYFKGHENMDILHGMINEWGLDAGLERPMAIVDKVITKQKRVKKPEVTQYPAGKLINYPEDKVKCSACGSEIFPKNMPRHIASAKHQKAIKKNAKK